MIDLAVVGGGPAGLMTALTAARRDLSVRVYEPRDAPLDKACGEGLMPAGVAKLQALGIELEGHPFTGVRYIQGANVAVGLFNNGTGLGVRRTLLHGRLHAACVDAGVDFVRRSARSIVVGEDCVRFSEGSARYLAVADGLNSPARRSLGLEAPRTWPERFGLRQHFRVAPWCEQVQVYWSERCEAYVTPVSANEVGVALLFKRGTLERGTTQERYDSLIDDFPELRRRLTHATSTVRGAGPFSQQTHARTRGRALLVGDAAGYLDPITGEGLRLAAECAPELVDAVIAEDPQQYERAWTRLTAHHFRSTGLLLSLASRPWTRKRIVSVAATIPGLMNGAIRVLGGA